MATSQNDLPPQKQAFAWAFEAAEKQDWQQAAARWAILRQAYPSAPGPWAQGAFAELQAGCLDQAESLLEHVAKTFPDHAPGLLHTAELATRRNDTERAANLLEAARIRFPDFVHSWIASAKFAGQCRNLEQALQFNAKAISLCPEGAIGFIQKGQLLMDAGAWLQALEAWKNVRDRFPHLPDGYLRGSDAARSLGNPQLARRILLEQQYGKDTFTGTTSESAPRTPSPHRYLSLIWAKAIFGLRAEVSRSFLSYGWWVIEPLLHMVVYQFVFGFLLNRGGQDYPIFLLTGLVPWMWVAKSVSGGSSSILQGENLMLQVGVPPAVFPAVVLLKSCIKQIPIFLLLFTFVWIMGHPPTAAWLLLLPLILVQGLLVAAFTGFVAAAIPFLRDLNHLVPTGLMFLMFLSGVFYDYRTIGEGWQQAFLWNPFAFILKSYREILLYGQAPDMLRLGLWGVVSLLACTLLFFLFRKLRYTYPRVILR